MTSTRYDIVEEWGKGLSLRELAVLFRISTSTVRRHLRANGCDTCSRGTLQHVKWAELRTEYTAGATIPQLAREHSLAVSTVYRHLKDLVRFPRSIYASSSYKTKEGYVLIQVGDARRLQHIVVMEHIIGRKLDPGEEVHHIDGVKYNNARSNLCLFMTRSAHNKAHLSLRRVATDWLIKEGLYPSKPGRAFWGCAERIGWVLYRFGRVDFKEGRYVAR